MGVRISKQLERRIARWLTRERPVPQTPLCDFGRLCYELRPGDVLLVEGRSRVGNVIKLITQSPWTHSALYIGRLFDIEDSNIRARLTRHFHGSANDQLVVEALLGHGTIVSPLSSYHQDHLRICRARGLSGPDAQNVINYAIAQLGTDYDTRQLLDLARFLFPYAVLPRRWRSSLFEHNAGSPTETVCSTMLAEAFASVNFPILPFVHKADDGQLTLYKRNPKLFAPCDFDYSPYFEIIKYPYLGLEDVQAYRKLPWNEEILFNDSVDQLPDLAHQDKKDPGPPWYDTFIRRFTSHSQAKKKTPTKEPEVLP